MSSLKKILIPAAALATIFMATGCSEVEVNRADQLTENLMSEAVRREEGIKDFKLIGTEVDKVGFEFDVNMNGVAKLDNGGQAFTSFTYKVPSTYFEKLTKRSSATSVYDVLDSVVENLEYTDCTISPVTDIKDINTTFVHNAPSPFDGYGIKKGVIYNLSTPTFNKENNEVSFNVKTLMDVKKVKFVSDVGIGWNLFGMCFTLGLGVTIRASEGTFVTDDTYKFTTDNQTIKEMEQDSSLVYTYVADAIKAKDNDKISANRNTTNYVTYDKANLLSNFDMNKVAESYNTL